MPHITKPQIAESFIDRRRLYQQLDRWKSVRVVLIRAPIGYGKPPLVSRWIEVCNQQAYAASLDTATSYSRVR